jgi:endonuclease YncB( thermonuclease family)
MDEHSDLKSADYQVKEFSMNGKNMWGKVVYVYDGDTVHIVFKIDKELVKFNCRLSGIDSPEIAPKNISDVKLKKEKELSAIKSRNYLISKVVIIPLEKERMNKNEIKAICAKSTNLVWVKCYDFDKYGRLLIELYDNPNSSKSFNQDMIEKKYALGYDGGTKKEFSESDFN